MKSFIVLSQAWSRPCCSQYLRSVVYAKCMLENLRLFCKLYPHVAGAKIRLRIYS